MADDERTDKQRRGIRWAVGGCAAFAILLYAWYILKHFLGS